MRNEKTAAVNSGLNQKFNNAGSTIKGFDSFDFRGNAALRQCKKCRSDYMKYSTNGYCQDCQQRVEFILRERRNYNFSGTSAGGFLK